MKNFGIILSLLQKASVYFLCESSMIITRCKSSLRAWKTWQHTCVSDKWLISKAVTPYVSERHLAPQRGLHPPPPGHTPVFNSQGHVSGPDLQPSQTAAEDHPSSENHPHTGSVPHEHHNPNLCLVLMLTVCYFFSGQLEQERKIKSGKLELMIDGVHYYIMVSTISITW